MPSEHSRTPARSATVVPLRHADDVGIARSVPCDIEAEQSTLGGMLLSKAAIAEVRSVLDPGDYYRPAHETIHRAILDMHDRGEPADPITLADRLRRTGDLARVGGQPYLHTLVSLVPTAANAAYYAEIVRAMATKRRLTDTGIRITQMGQAADGDPDEARALALEALQAGSGQDQGWPDPIPLGETGPLPTFPVDTLPTWVGQMVAAVAEFTQTPPDAAATVALAALSTAAGGRVHVQIRPGWVEQSNLYLVCAMPPASRKSDVFAFMVSSIYEVEQQMQGDARASIIEAQTAKEAAEAEADALMAKARKPGDDVDRQSLVKEIAAARLLAEETHVPPKPKLTADGNDTPESLSAQLAAHRCLAVLSPEGDLVDIIAGRYSSKPNLGVYLKAHRGERLQAGRITREQPTADKPALTIGITPQPAVLQDLAAAPGARDRGLLARFLYSLPPSNLGWREVRTAPIPDTVVHTYNTRLTSLIQTLTALPEPVTLPMTPAADKAVEGLQEALEVSLRPDQPLAHLQDWGGKLVGATARIACLLHLADRLNTGWSQPIDAETVNRAADITAYYTAHAIAVFDLIGSDPATADAQTILDWLKRPKNDGTWRTRIKRRDAVAASRRFRTVTQVDPALALLEQHGYLQAEQMTKTGRVGHPSTATYRVHPSLREATDAGNPR